MSDMPETIWAMAPYIGEYLADPPVTPEDHLYLTEYRRADLPATDAQAMANPKVQALVMEVKAAIVCLDAGVLDGFARLRLEEALSALEIDT